MVPDIVITPEGGHATVWMGGQFANARYPMHLRPDTSFGWELDFDELPLPQHEKQWKWRSKTELDYDVSINDNILRFLEETKKKTLLCGRVSGNGKGMFLTRFGVEALCVVRHPATAMAIFLGTQHPEHAQRFTGGPVNTVACAEWYGERWKRMIRDFLDSSNMIVRHETMVKDLMDHGLHEVARILGGWDPNRRPAVALDDEVIEVLKGIVKPEFGELYGTHWTKWKKHL